MKTVAIIGGGASGLIAATFASMNNKVIIIEKLNTCGKKILVTGNGKCNYWNSNQDLIHYNSSDIEVLKEINTEENRKEVLNFFDKLGIVPCIKNGYYYPYSKEASTIKKALVEEVERNNVEVYSDTIVNNIIKKEEKFIISSNKEKFIVDSVILATGSLAYYRDDNSNIGYEIAKSFKHSVIKVLPALVQLKGIGDFFKEWKGVRHDVNITLLSDDKEIKKETGEILLTEYGISGICVFNISGIASRLLEEKKKLSVRINFIPWYQEKNFVLWLDERDMKTEKMTIDNFLEGFLNSKLVKVLLKKSGISSSGYWKELTLTEKKTLVENIQRFKLEITGTNSFNQAQVCSGGIPLSEINPETMESKKEKGLYLVGEILDVDGECGGYNLSFAFLTGMIAGKSVK